MEPAVYVFHIDAFTPDTMPMGRLAEYLAVLTKLLGSADHTHFVKIEDGSAKLVHKVDPVDALRVEGRLRELAAGNGPQDALAARDKLDDLLANDNAVGELNKADGAVVIPFPGRTRPKVLTFPAFRQDGSIEGQVVSVGGRDSTAHAILQDGDVTFSGLSMKRDLARELARHLYGQKVRLTGSGRWERHSDGSWKLLEFRVDRFELLDERPLADVLEELREIPENGLMEASAYSDIFNLNSGDGGVH